MRRKNREVLGHSFTVYHDGARQHVLFINSVWPGMTLEEKVLPYIAHKRELKAP